MGAHLDSAVSEQTSGIEQLLSGYRPLPGIFDEMMGVDGRVRAHCLARCLLSKKNIERCHLRIAAFSQLGLILRTS